LALATGLAFAFFAGGMFLSFVLLFRWEANE